MKPIDAITTAFRKYATFAGVASRSEYWWFTLLYVLVNAIFVMVQNSDRDLTLAVWGFSALWGLGVFLPGLAVTVRRFHDAGFSGWWLLLWIVAILLTMSSFAQTVSAGFIGMAPVDSSTNLQGPVLGAAGALLGALGFMVAMAIFQLVVTLRPSKSKDAGNKYA